MKLLNQGRKHGLMRGYQMLFRMDTLVETGTWFGGTVAALEPLFKRVISIEFDKELAARAKKQFAGKKHVRIIQGDSGKVLGKAVSRVQKFCLFWLDAHYSRKHTARANKETPIIAELRHVLDHQVKNHCILIDDARMFTGQGDWPRLDEITSMIQEARPKWVISVRDDILRAHPLLKDL